MTDKECIDALKEGYYHKIYYENEKKKFIILG